MNEVPQSPPSCLSNDQVMPFYNAIKEIPGLYGKTFAIQERIDESNKRFTCTIILGEPLSKAQDEEIYSEILEIIQTQILPVLSPGFQSTIGDITFQASKENGNVGVSTGENGNQKTSHREETGDIFEGSQRLCSEIRDLFLQDIEQVQVLLDEKHNVLKLHITLNKAIDGQTMRVMRQKIEHLVTENILPTLPGYTFSEREIGFLLPSARNLEATIARANMEFAGVNVKSVPGLYSSVGLSISQIFEVLGHRLLPPR